MKRADVSSAYDAIAAAYDEQVRADEWMRQALWQHFRQTFQPGERVLDVACGTGADAVFLARQGIRVLGIDASPNMIAQLRTKVSAHRLADRIDSRIMDFSDLAALPPACFDGIISSFAGLNTANDLAPFAADAARLLRPGGRMVLHLLSRFSVWEWLGLVAHRQWHVAGEVGRQTERAFTIGGQTVPHYLFDPDETFRRFFTRSFRRRRLYSLGCLRPPPTVRRIPPAIVPILGCLERGVASHRPFVNWGRFFVLELQRRDELDAVEPGGRW